MSDKKNEPIEDQKDQKTQIQPTELEKVQQEAEENKKRYLRALADYQNLERRIRDERTEIAKNAQADIITKLLPFLDNLEKAVIFINDPGLQIIKNNFYETLKQFDLKEIDLVGNEYDPYFAEAVEVVEGDKDDIIVEVVQKGYMFKGKILRPAQVKVSKKKAA